MLQPIYARRRSYLIPLTLLGLMTIGGTVGAIVQNVGSPQAAVAHSFAVNNTGANSYAMTISFGKQTVANLVQGYCPSYCTYTINNTWQNISAPTTLAATLYFGETWVNGTGACGNVACPSGTVNCDGIGYVLTPAASNLVGGACFGLALSWPSGTFQSPSGLQTLNYTVTRLLTYVTIQKTAWTAAGMKATETASIASPSSALWTGSPIGWQVRSASWVLPFPKGNWDYTQVSLTQLPNQTPLASSAYAIFTQYALVQWTGGFPTTVGSSTTLQFVLTITTISGAATVTAWKLTNQSYPTSQPAQGSIITLPLGNQTFGTGGYEQLQVSWTNPYSSAYTGQYDLTSNDLATATEVNLTANGQVIPSYDYQLSGATLVIQSGVVPIANSTTVTFTVSFLPKSTWSMFSTVYVLNGFQITPIFIIGVSTGLGSVLLWIAMPKIGWGRTALNDVIGLVGATSLIILWVVL